jgi:hypothetical protein
MGVKPPDESSPKRFRKTNSRTIGGLYAHTFQLKEFHGIIRSVSSLSLVCKLPILPKLPGGKPYFAVKMLKLKRMGFTPTALAQNTHNFFTHPHPTTCSPTFSRRLVASAFYSCPVPFFSLSFR